MKLLLAFLLFATSGLSIAEERAPSKITPAAPDQKLPRESGAIRYEGGDGSSVEKAVIIKGAKDSEAGVRSEYEWLKKVYPGHKVRRQGLQGKSGRRYDVIAISTKDGKDLDVFFDISDFFGKF